MEKLRVWSLDAEDARDRSRQPHPQRVDRSHIELERHLEDWIADDVTLIADGLTLVGRQVSIDGGRLDLLAIDSQDRWVVIEIKPDLLYPGALTQALTYASSIARVGRDELEEKLRPGLGQFGDVNRLSDLVRRELDREGDTREVAVLLVGTGIDPGLERVNEFLGRFGVPISVVIREVVEEPVPRRTPRRRFTVEAVRQLAAEECVEPQFDRFLRIARDAGLAVQPHSTAVRIAPPAIRTRFLMFASPREGGMTISTSAAALVEFFPSISEAEARQALGPESKMEFFDGPSLDERLDRIEGFLTATLPRPDTTAA